MKLISRFAIFIMSGICCFQQLANAQLSVNTTYSPTQLAGSLANPGMVISNVSFTGDSSSRGSFDVNGGNLGITKGILLTTGNCILAVGPNTMTSAGINLAQPGDSLLSLLADTITFDAAILEFDFISSNDSVFFRYVFGSEEYPEYVCSIYNDVFAFFINGPGINGIQNIALVPGDTIPVSINSVNIGTIGIYGSPGPNCILGDSAFYVDNTNGTTTQFDGFTTKLTASAHVTPGVPYHMKIAIADAGDGVYDSGLFLEGNAVSTSGINEADVSSGIKVFPNPGKDNLTITLPGKTKNVEVRIADVNGKIIYSNYTTGKQMIELNIPTIFETEGVYFVQIQSDNFFKTEKLVVVK